VKKNPDITSTTRVLSDAAARSMDVGASAYSRALHSCYAALGKCIARLKKRATGF
jgi:hypothetical protein